MMRVILVVIYVSLLIMRDAHVSATYPSLIPGDCPPVPEIGICVTTCASDAECGLGKKCCYNGCGKICKDTIATDLCSMQKDSGTCSGFNVRYFYNTESRSCETFIYGGCHGNANRFNTLSECQNACMKSSCEGVVCNPGYQCQYGKCIKIDTGTVCTQSKAIGPCSGYYYRYFYNFETGACESFIYGGCQGNDNNFVTHLQCQQTCQHCKAQCEVTQRCIISGSVWVCVPQSKPGSCPASLYTNTCVGNTCSHDYQCAGNEKCCTNSCQQTQCVTPP